MDFEKIAKLTEEKGVKHIYMDDTGQNTKTMQIFPMDLESMSEKSINAQNERLNFLIAGKPTNAFVYKRDRCIRVQGFHM